MQQVVSIHGGGEFIPLKGETMLELIEAKEPTLERMRRKTSWKANLQDALGDRYDVFSPHMPNADAPKYEEWKCWFEKILPLLEKNALFVGHSLGALFLIKYFSELNNWGKVKALFLVAPPYFTETSKQPDYGWALKDVELLTNNAEKIFFYHSSDDPVVNFSDLSIFKEKLPKVTYRELEGRGHFNKDNFPEIIDDIKGL